MKKGHLRSVKLADMPFLRFLIPSVCICSVSLPGYSSPGEWQQQSLFRNVCPETDGLTPDGDRDIIVLFNNYPKKEKTCRG